MTVAVAHDAIPLASITRVGRGLNRPECVLANAHGDLFTADWRGGVARIRPDGSAGTLPLRSPRRPPAAAQWHRAAPRRIIPVRRPRRPTGAACSHSGATAPSARFVEEVDGIALPPSNFVVEDARGRVWITVSTRRVPRALGYRRDVADGFVVLVDERGRAHRRRRPRLHQRGGPRRERPGGCTSTKRSRGSPRAFPCAPDGGLGAREVFVEYGTGTYPDGLAFDEEGHLWIVSHRQQPRAARRAGWHSGDHRRGCGSGAPRLGRAGVPRRRARPAAPRRREEPPAAQHLEHCLRRRPTGAPRISAACSTMRSTPSDRPSRASAPAHWNWPA